MSAQNQITVNLVGIGGIAPYTFAIIADAETTIPATISGSTATVDATSLAPGTYSVHVSITDNNGSVTTQVIPVRVVDPSIFSILTTSVTLAPQVFPVNFSLPLSSIGGVGTVSYALVSAVTTLPGVSIVSGVLTASIPGFGTWTVGVRATDSLSNTVTRVLEVTIASTNAATVVDGQLQLQLAPEAANVGTHQFTASILDSASNVATQTFNYTVDEPISVVEISAVAADHDWGAGDATEVVFPITGDLSGYSVGPSSPVVAANGLTATIDTEDNAIIISGPPNTNYGNSEINLSIALVRDNTQVATLTQTFSLMSHSGTTDIGNFTCKTIPYQTGQYIALNPLRPYFNAPNLTKNQTYTLQMVLNNTLPLGLSLDSVSGQIYGTVLAGNVAQSQLQYVDASGTVHGTVTIVWDIQTSAFSVIDEVQDGQIQVAYSLSLSTSSSSALTGVTVYRGHLPGGLALGIDSTSSLVQITGAPTEAGFFDLWLAVNNANGQIGYFYKRLVIDYIAPLIILTTEIPQVLTSIAYSMTLAAFGGTAPFHWSIATGTLPTGLSLNATSGAITGTTTLTSFSQSVVFAVTDARGVVSTQAILVAINNALAIATTTLPLVNPGQNYQFRLVGQGGVPGYTWALGSGSAALPGGFTLSSSGLLSGVTSLSSYDENIIIQVTDTANNVVTATFLLAIGVPSGLTIDTEGIGPIVRGQAYQGILAVDGAGIAPYNWSVAPDSPNAMPTGLALFTSTANSGATATVSGETIVALDNYSVKIQVVDSNANVASVFLLLNTYSTLAITTTGLPQATASGNYSTQLAASGINTPFTWSLDSTSPALPTGLTLLSNGLLSGVPTAVGTTNLVFRVTDTIGDYATAALPFASIQSTLAIVTSGLTNVIAGVPYSTTLAATGGTPAYAWSIANSSAATLPPGLTLNASTGAITGTTVSVGFNRIVTFQVTDSIGVIRTIALAIVVSSSLKVVSGPDYINKTSLGSLGVVAQGNTSFINPRPNLSFYVVATGVVSTKASQITFGLPTGFTATVSSLSGGIAIIQLNGPFSSIGVIGSNKLAMNLTDSGVSLSVGFTWTRYAVGAVTLAPASGSFPVLVIE
jgi:hypothetical protein